MDFSPPSSPPPEGRPRAQTLPDRPASDAEATSRQHWGLLCAAVLERLAAIAAHPPASPGAPAWAEVLDCVAELQKLRVVAEWAAWRHDALAQESRRGARKGRHGD